MYFRTSSGTWNDLSCSKPKASLVNFVSLSPRGAPWEAAVFLAFGAGQAIIVLSRIKLGLSDFFDDSIALDKAEIST